MMKQESIQEVVDAFGKKDLEYYNVHAGKWQKIANMQLADVIVNMANGVEFRVKKEPIYWMPTGGQYWVVHDPAYGHTIPFSTAEKANACIDEINEVIAKHREVVGER